MSDTAKDRGELERELAFWREQLADNPQSGMADAMRARIKVIEGKLRDSEQK
jgi:hypothetical protein